MFIDYISLMPINMVAGLFILAYYVYSGLDGADQKRWIPGFGMTGAIALTTGLHMIFTWPIPGSFNIAFGEMSVLLGIVFIGASVALAQNWELVTVTIYAFFAGVASILVGLRIITLGVTTHGLLPEAKVSGGFVVKLARTHPIYAVNYQEALSEVNDYLNQFENLDIICRYGAFKYHDQDGSLYMGILAGENAVSNSGVS